MAGVIKEFLCFAHGPFEAREPVCPSGCTLVEREFRTPVGLRTRASIGVDKTLDTIARDYKLSDINTRRDATVGRVTDAKTRKAMEQQVAMREHLTRKFSGSHLVDTQHGVGGWGGVPKQGGVPAMMAASGAPTDNALESVKDALVKPKTIPIRDPQNLSVKDAKVA